MYLVLEIYQTTESANAETVTYPRATKDEALSTYHYILYQASVSQNYRHGAVIMQPDGKYVARESYVHLQVTEPTDE